MVLAEEFIKKCNVLPIVHAKEGGVIELKSLLKDFVVYKEGEEGKSSFTEKTQKETALQLAYELIKFRKNFHDNTFGSLVVVYDKGLKEIELYDEGDKETRSESYCKTVEYLTDGE